MSESLLRWSREWDDSDNTEWHASVGGDDETYEYRIKQRLLADKHEWYEASSPELMRDENEPRVWASADSAKEALEKDCEEMSKSFGEHA